MFWLIDDLNCAFSDSEYLSYVVDRQTLPDLLCPGMARISEEEEENVKVKHVQQPSLNEIKHDIENISQKIEVLHPFHKQAAIHLLQDCIDRLQLQLGSDAIPQIDGNFDLVIFCEFCNKEFTGDKRVRDSQTHCINVHLKSRFQEKTPMKSENCFVCNKTECEQPGSRVRELRQHLRPHS